MIFAVKKLFKFAKEVNRGFTLIELLVVIAIIGLISSVVLASLNSARAKARDARRQEDAYQLRTALSAYFNDYGYFPLCGPYEGAAPNGGFTTRSYDANWDSCLGVKLRPYISEVPKDPNNSSYYYYFCPATSAASPTCGESGVYLNIYFETKIPNFLALDIK